MGRLNTLMMREIRSPLELSMGIGIEKLLFLSLWY